MANNEIAVGIVAGLLVGAIKVNTNKLLTYVPCGIFAGLTGVIILGIIFAGGERTRRK